MCFVMSKISEDNVRHIAKLARIHLSGDEVIKFSHQLNGVFEYMDILAEVDIDGVEPTAQVTGLLNVYREDIVAPFSFDPKALLECSPLSLQADQIKVKSVF